MPKRESCQPEFRFASSSNAHTVPFNAAAQIPPQPHDQHEPNRISQIKGCEFTGGAYEGRYA